MRIRVLGAGSIGSRHARNLIALGASVEVSDPDESRPVAIRGAEPVADTLDGLDRYDGVVVASPTSKHLHQAAVALRAGCRVLVEKPLAADLDGLDELVSRSAGRLAVGYNLRFHPPVVRAIGLVSEGRVGRIRSVRVWFGSWLPDWRPSVDYRTTYSAQRELGGGILLDAIHELDLLVWMLGPDLDVVGAFVERVGPLEIDCEDTVKAVLRSAEGVPAEVSLDYLSRRYRRGIEVVGDEGTLRLDWSTATITVESQAETVTEPADVDIDRSYKAEASAFLGWLGGGPALPVDGDTGAASVRLAATIRDRAEPRP